jgi:hypothetical protein
MPSELSSTSAADDENAQAHRRTEQSGDGDGKGAPLAGCRHDRTEHTGDRDRDGQDDCRLEDDLDL